MKFTRIRFKNYRCFMDGEIDFTLPKGTPKSKNIVLFSAENGGGKTQLMFAFRFALYGLSTADFRSIQGQATLDYALNQNVHEALAHGREGCSAEAMVELSFQYDGQLYTVKRTHVYSRKPGGGVSAPSERVVLYIQDSMGDTTTISEPLVVRARINKIIPEKTLYALLCDGERVRQLSSAGQETDNAILAVIQRMSELSLLKTTNAGIDKVRKQVHARIKKNAVGASDRIPDGAYERLERTISQLEEEIDGSKEAIRQAQGRMNEISVDLKGIALVRELEQRRELLRASIKENEQSRQEAEQALVVTLNDQAYWGIADSLSKNVSDLLKDISLRFPGLQSGMVETVLKGDKCICGRPIDEVARKVLEELMLHLPPINIDAELSEVLRLYGQDEFRTKIRRDVKERIRAIDKIKAQINEKQDEITTISNEIEHSTNPDAAALEEENQRCLGIVVEENRKLGVKTEELRESQEELQNLKQKIAELAARVDNGRELELMLNLLQGAQQGIEFIKDFREKTALARINHFLGEAFSHLRSRSDSQRQVYITMFDGQHRLVVYHTKSVEKELLAQADPLMSEEERARLRERLILLHENGNSMGQLKMTSLAFMKAVLDYVKEIASQNQHMADAAYPIVLDAPFGDIKRDNFDNAVSFLHEFADQVILLLADEEMPDGIEPYVGKVYSVRRVRTPDRPYEYSEILQVS